MNFKRYLVSAIALFIVFFLYDWLVHGMLFVGMYHQTPQVWRDMMSMEAMMPLAILLKAVFSFWVAFVFVQLFKKGGLTNGLRYGLYLGGIVGIITASSYLWLPISAQLAWCWFISWIVEGLVGGAVLGLTYRH